MNTGKRRGWRRAAWLLVALMAGLTLWFFFFSLPLGWAINLAARRALPPGLAARVQSTWFRWRIGEPSLRLDVRGLAATAAQQPLADVAEIVVEVNKATLWKKNFAPTLVAVRAPRLTVSPAALAEGHGAAPSRPVATPVKPDAPAFALSDLDPVLPLSGAKTQVTIDDLVVDSQLPQWRWRSPAVRIEVNATRVGDEMKLEVATQTGGPLKPLRAEVKVAASFATKKAVATVTLPEFRTADLPPLPLGPLPLEGTLALTARAEVNLSTLKPTAGNLDLRFTNGLLRLPALGPDPLAIERVEISGHAKPGKGDEFTWDLEKGSALVEGVKLEVQKFTAVLGAQAKAGWEMELTTASAARYVARVPEAILKQQPWLAPLMAQVHSAEFRSSGEASLSRISFAPEQLITQSSFHALVGSENLACEIGARLLDRDDVEAGISVAPFVPARLAPALPAEIPLAVCRFPVSFSGKARLTSAGELVLGEASVSMGAGEFGPWGPLRAPLVLRRALLTARARDGATVLEVPECLVETGMGRMVVDNLRVQREGLAAIEASGRLQIADVAGEEAAKLLPANALAPLKDFGAKPADFALTRLIADFSARLQNAPKDPWHPTRANAKAELTLGVAGKPLVLHGDVDLPSGAADVTAHCHIDEFRPTQFGSLGATGFTAKDFDFPVRLEGAARLGGRDGQPRAITARLQIGAGQVRVPSLGTTLPLRQIAVEAEFDPIKNVARVPSVSVQLSDRLQFAAERIALNLTPLEISGTAKLLPLTLADVMAWWPEKLLPPVRAQVKSLGASAQVEMPAMEFAARAEGADKMPVKARGEIRLASAAVSLPDVGAAEMKLARGVFSGTATLVNGKMAEARADLDFTTEHLAVAKLFEGPLALGTHVTISDPNTISATAQLDVTKARMVVAGHAIRTGPISIGSTLHQGAQALESAEFSVAGEIERLPFAAKGSAHLREQKPDAVTMSELSLGHTLLNAEWRQVAPQHEAIKVTGARIDLAQLAATAAPWLPTLLEESPPTPTKKGSPTKQEGSSAPSKLRRDVSLAIAQMDFGNRRNLREFKVDAALEDNWPLRLALRAMEGEANALAIDLEGTETQTLKLSVHDIAALLHTCTEPARLTPLPKGKLADAVGSVAQVPLLLAGGRLTLEGHVQRRAAGISAGGNFLLTDATMIRAPRILQLLALKSGKQLEHTPLIRELSVGEWTFDPEQVALTKLNLLGSGLIDKVKLNAARYAQASGKVAVDGAYFGVGFEVIGTRADPQVFLKDNAVIRAIGQRNEFDVFFEEPPPAPPKK